MGEDRKDEKEEESNSSEKRQNRSSSDLVTELVEHITHFVPTHVGVAFEPYHSYRYGCSVGRKQQSNHECVPYYNQIPYQSSHPISLSQQNHHRTHRPVSTCYTIRHHKVPVPQV